MYVIGILIALLGVKHAASALKSEIKPQSIEHFLKLPEVGSTEYSIISSLCPKKHLIKYADCSKDENLNECKYYKRNTNQGTTISYQGTTISYQGTTISYPGTTINYPGPDLGTGSLAVNYAISQSLVVIDFAHSGAKISDSICKWGILHYDIFKDIEYSERYAPPSSSRGLLLDKGSGEVYQKYKKVPELPNLNQKRVWVVHFPCDRENVRRMRIALGSLGPMNDASFKRWSNCIAVEFLCGESLEYQDASSCPLPGYSAPSNIAIYNAFRKFKVDFLDMAWLYNTETWIYGSVRITCSSKVYNKGAFCAQINLANIAFTYLTNFEKPQNTSSQCEALQPVISAAASNLQKVVQNFSLETRWGIQRAISSSKLQKVELELVLLSKEMKNALAQGRLIRSRFSHGGVIGELSFDVYARSADFYLRQLFVVQERLFSTLSAIISSVNGC